MSSATKECPYGFICGFPTTTGDMYAGSMFCSSLDESAQGKAIKAAEARWEIKCMSVCKAKYMPFRSSSSKEGEKLERLYGCNAHHEIRRQRLDEHGPRPGWVDFAQWHGNQWSFGTPRRKKKGGTKNNGQRR